MTNEEFEAAPDADKPVVPPPAPANTVEPENLGDAAASGFPEVDGSGFQAASGAQVPQGGTTPPPPIPPGPRDSAGVEFDPSKHRTDEQGNPLKTAKGEWKKKYTRRRDDGERDEYDETADMICDAVIKLHATVFDLVEAIPDPQFKESMARSYAAACRHKKLSITDPVWSAIGMTALYTGSVVSQPKSKEKALSIWEGIKARFQRRRKGVIDVTAR